MSAMAVLTGLALYRRAITFVLAASLGSPARSMLDAICCDKAGAEAIDFDLRRVLWRWASATAGRSRLCSLCQHSLLANCSLHTFNATTSASRRATSATSWLSLAVFWRLPSFWRSKPLATFSARCSIFLPCSVSCSRCVLCRLIARSGSCPPF